MARDDDSVGYGRPPKATRFAKGTSGNPSGRPRGSRDLRADLQDELAELISVNDEAGGPQRITKQRARESNRAEGPERGRAGRECVICADGPRQRPGN